MPREPSAEVLPIDEACRFGDRNECVLDELLGRMQDLELGYQNQSALLKKQHNKLDKVSEDVKVIRKLVERLARKRS